MIYNQWHFDKCRLRRDSAAFFKLKLTLLLDNIFIRLGTKLYRQVVEIPMGTICAPLVADLFLFCYERDFMMSLSNY